MRTLILITSIFLISCSQKLRVSNNNKSVIELINAQHAKTMSIRRGSSFQTYDKLVYEIRRKAEQLYEIGTDTSNISRFIVIDLVSFEGGKTTYGEMILNDTSKYFYKQSFLSKQIEKHDYPISSEAIILEYLKTHRFKELENLANEKGKMLSGSNFFYIGIYERGMDSIYVGVLPAFM
jgi:hypothetical protein